MGADEKSEECTLTEREHKALLALAKISSGQQTFLNVLDADMLVRKGLADIFGKGQYVLTEQGSALIKKWNTP
jgi:hypothetical protein